MRDSRIAEIKKRCRLAMNGVVSSSMRQHGVNYKLNFGLTQPLIRRIAEQYPPDATLASTLWEENTRELKMLATLLYPTPLFTIETARQWAEEITTYEIADYCTSHLFCHVEEIDTLALEWIASPNEVLRYLAFQLFNKLITKEYHPSETTTEQLALALTKETNQGSSVCTTAALNMALRWINKIPLEGKRLLEETEKLSPASELLEVLREEYRYVISNL